MYNEDYNYSWNESNPGRRIALGLVLFVICPPVGLIYWFWHLDNWIRER